MIFQKCTVDPYLCLSKKFSLYLPPSSSSYDDIVDLVSYIRFPPFWLRNNLLPVLLLYHLLPLVINVHTFYVQ